jgi:hypothetical protein
MTTTVEVTIAGADGSQSRRVVEVRRQYNLGSATRDAATAEHHQQEVAKAGIKIAFDVPAPRIYPIGPWALTTDGQVTVQGARTSGEVEIVLVVDDEVYVGVGSDHTDRELERVSIPWSKQVCPNVLAPVLWRWADVRGHWDSCTLACDLDGEPYQRVGVEAFLDPDAVLEILRERADVPDAQFAVFCGTYVSLSGSLGFGSEWSFSLEDPVLGRSISHAYEVVGLLDELQEGYRVPLLSVEA